MDKLLETFEGGNIDTQQQVQLIGCDPVLSTRLVAMANVFQDPPAPAPTLQQALAALGSATLRTLIVTFAIRQSSAHQDNFSTPALKRFWRHSLYCAHLARHLAEITAYPEPETAYLAGLLHDLGKLILSVRQANPSAEIQPLNPVVATLHEAPVLQDQPRSDPDHYILGAALLDVWKLPPLLGDAIRFHHLNAAELRGAHPLLRLLYVANVLSQETECPETLVAEGADLLDLSPVALKQAAAEIEPAVGVWIAELDIAAHRSEGETNSAPVRTSLQHTVNELALIDAVRVEFSKAENEISLWETVSRCAAMLFDLIEVHFFQYDQKTNRLQASFDGWPDGFAIDPAGAANAFQRALREQRMSHSLDAEIPAGVIDRQLARQWGSDGVWCLPLYAGERLIGVLQAGISRAQLPRLLVQERLLRWFSAAAATALDDLSRHEIQRRRAHEDRELLERQHLRVVLHEIANPLTIVRHYLYLLAGKVGDQAVEELRVLQEETERASRILRRFARLEKPLPEPSFDLNKTIHDLARILDEALCRPQGITLTLNLADDLALLTQGRDAVLQILLNLIRNAVEAMKKGGHVTVTTQDGIHLNGRVYLEIAVADDGPGFPETLRAQLFQPVASAKGEGHAGLGLSIVKNLVEELGGHVGYRPNPGGGAVFLVLLPHV